MTRRITAFLLIAVSIFGLVSCAGNQKGVQPSLPTTTPQTTAPNITTPEITTPEITTPEITTPEVTTPEITTPEPIAPPEVNTVYDFVKNFKNLEGTNFSLKMGHPVQGLVDTYTKWYNGEDPSVKNSASGSALVGYRTGNDDGFSVDVALMNGNIVWYPKTLVYNVICFTAPADGTYAYDFITYSYWGCTHSSSAYMVVVDGKIHNYNSVSYPKGTLKNDSVTNFVGTTDLLAGETIYFIYDPEDSAASDNSGISKLTVTYMG